LTGPADLGTEIDKSYGSKHGTIKDCPANGLELSEDSRAFIFLSMVRLNPVEEESYQ